MTDFFDAEQPIIDRLTAQITLEIGGKNLVFASGVTLGGAADLSSLCPIAFVMPGEAKATEEEQSDDGSAPETQKWSVVLLIKALPDLQNRKNTYASAAGGALAAIRNALTGWAPAGAGAVLHYAGRPAPTVPAPGVLELAIDFELPAMAQAN